jgi:hypothetical protein
MSPLAWAWNGGNRIITGAIVPWPPWWWNVILIVNQTTYIPALRAATGLRHTSVAWMMSWLIRVRNHFHKADGWHTHWSSVTTMTTRYDGFEGYHFLFPTRKPSRLNIIYRTSINCQSPEWNPHARLFDEMNVLWPMRKAFCNNPQRRSIMQFYTDAGSLIDAGTPTSESISVVPRVPVGISNSWRLFVNAIRSTVEVTYDGYAQSEIIPNQPKSISSARPRSPDTSWHQKSCLSSMSLDYEAIALHSEKPLRLNASVVLACPICGRMSHPWLTTDGTPSVDFMTLLYFSLISTHSSA